MRISTYRTKLNENRVNVLAEESVYEYEADPIGNPAAVMDILNDMYGLKDLAEEYIYMVAVNNKMKAFAVFEVSHGTVNSALTSPREIYIRALLCGATSIFLVHNHPSGETVPSQDDIKSMKSMDEAGKILGVKLLDAIIVGEGYYSFRENKLLL